MSSEHFSYVLPSDRIAERPIKPADAARLLCVENGTGVITHRLFSDLTSLTRPGDVFVLNETKVSPARLFGVTATGADVEVLILSRTNKRAVCMARPLKRFKQGGQVDFGDGLVARIGQREGDAAIELFFEGLDEPLLSSLINQQGSMPIPPYIRDGIADEDDLIDYQTVFAAVSGSVAAPTASLHFTSRLLETLENNGVVFEKLVLHLGAGSFRPLDGAPPAGEQLQIIPEQIQRIQAAKRNGQRIIAVGTSVTRALESAIRPEVLRQRDQGVFTELFIQPGFEFGLIDGLITNFHQPGTTHLLLVEALLGRRDLERCYEAALNNSYRFLSYGDAMFIIPEIGVTHGG